MNNKSITIIEIIKEKKMSDFNHILHKINESNIELPSSEKYDEIIESYKMIIVKVILSCELTLYNICNENGLKKNLKKNAIYDHINVFMQKILLFITENSITQDIIDSINKIIELSNNKNNVVHDKIFFLINNFYLNFDRKKLPCKKREDYKKYIVKNIITFLKNNSVNIIHVLNDNSYQWNGNYSLEIIEEENISESESESSSKLDAIEENVSEE